MAIYYKVLRDEVSQLYFIGSFFLRAEKPPKWVNDPPKWAKLPSNRQIGSKMGQLTQIHN